MVMLCDNCNVDITFDPEAIEGSEMKEYNSLQLNGGKKHFCLDCFIVLSEFACSPEHKKALEARKKEFE